jgi:flap endonuclease-1
MTALSPSAFLDFCILLGTDASPRIPTVGPTRAYKLIHKYGSIEEIMAKEPKYRERAESIEGFMEMVKSARKVFGRAPPIPEGVSLEQGKYDAKIVEAWLRDAHGVEFVYQDQMESEESSDGQVWAVDDDVDEMPVGRETWDEEWDATVSDSDSAGSGSR